MTIGDGFSGPIFERVEAIYDRYADFYDLCASPVRGDVACYLDLASGCDSVIDVGCGTGRITEPLLAAGLSVTGTDISPKMLDLCRARHAGPAGQRLTLLGHDLCDAPLASASDLAILSYFTFNYIVNEARCRAMLANLRESLAPDGRVAMECFYPKPLATETGVWSQAETVLNAEPLLMRSDSRHMRGDVEERLQIYRFRDEAFGFLSRRRYVTPQRVGELLAECGFMLQWISLDHGRTRLRDLPPVAPSTSFVAVAGKA